MADTYRTINTRLWSDSWIRKMNALDRYLFLYLLTNEHVSWCGIYELEIGMMAFECGIDKEDLQKTMLPRLEPKVIYEDGWVFIKNYARYHTGGKNADIGRKSAIAALPDRIKAKISHLLGKEEVESNPVEGGSPFASASAFASTSASAFNNAPPVGDIEKLLNEKGGITHDYQYLGLEVFEKTGAPTNKKGECIRLARDYSKFIRPALSFCLDYPNKALKWKMFLWKLNQLKKDDKANK